MSPQVCQTSTVELGANILHEMCPPHGYFITDIINNIIGTKLLKEKKVNTIIIIKNKKNNTKTATAGNNFEYPAILHA